VATHDADKPSSAGSGTEARVSDHGPIEVAVVTHDSAHVLAAGLRSILAAAPQRGVRVWVVDNASRDGSAGLAASLVGDAQVIRCAENRGYAAGVNRALERARSPWFAVLNPDVELPPGALDRLAGLLAAHPRAALVAPRVRDEQGRPEGSVGPFATLRRERAHAFYLEYFFGVPGRRGAFPNSTAPVDWASGCAWLLRLAAARAVGALDEEYFMYWEDMDYCRRIWSAGWEVLATPEVEVRHLLGRGSARTALLPADGGAGIVRYFRKFHPEVDIDHLKAVVTAGWRLRRWSHVVRAALGREGSRTWVKRFDLALDQMAGA
jgi:hypothetical protein